MADNVYNLKFTLSNGDVIDAGQITAPQGPKGDKGDSADIPYSLSTPFMDGVGSVGSANAVARGDHRHPSDTSRQEKLVSGTNIKTINGQSVLGSGDIKSYPIGSIYLSTSSATPSSLFGGTWEKIGTTGLPEAEGKFDIRKDVPSGQNVEITRISIPANTSAYIFGHTSADVSDSSKSVQCRIRVSNASNGSQVGAYTILNRTTMQGGGGTSASFYFPAVDYDCYAILYTYGDRSETTPMRGDLQVVKIPQDQHVWKRIA